MYLEHSWALWMTNHLFFRKKTQGLGQRLGLDAYTRQMGTPERL